VTVYVAVVFEVVFEVAVEVAVVVEVVVVVEFPHLSQPNNFVKNGSEGTDV